MASRGDSRPPGRPPPSHPVPAAQLHRLSSPGLQMKPITHVPPPPGLCLLPPHTVEAGPFLALGRRLGGLGGGPGRSGRWGGLLPTLVTRGRALALRSACAPGPLTS